MRLRILRHVAALEIRQLLQSRAVVAALVLVLLAGIAGIEYGRSVIERQRAALAESGALQQEQHAAILDPLPPASRAGDQLDYLFFHTAHEPSAWAPFPIEGYHTSWDRPVPDTMQRFYERYPEWAHVTVPQDTYSNAWYYAMQHAGDDDAAGAAGGYFDTLERRRRWTARAAALLPPAALQLAFNDIARTDLESHVNYRQSVADYHEQLKAFFFPLVFDDTKSIDAVAWRHAPVHRYRDVTAPAGLSGLHGLALGGAALAPLAIGTVRLRTIVSRPQ